MVGGMGLKDSFPNGSFLRLSFMCEHAMLYESPKETAYFEDIVQFGETALPP